MSRVVCIAKEGFKDTPIDKENWLSVAKSIEELVVDERENRLGQVHYRIYLKSDKKQVLFFSVYGIIDAVNPSKPLVTVMFKIAEQMGLKVYSERLKPYSSVEDWEKRTKRYRQEYNLRQIKATRRRIIGVILGLVWGGTVLWGLSVYKQSITHTNDAIPNSSNVK